MHVVVLGCGPAGLVAAHVARILAHDVTLVTKSWEPSPLYGCQYLHAPIPGFENVPHTRVYYRLIGTPEQYRKKVYGNKWKGSVSPEDFAGDHDAWSIRETYRRMFITFEGMKFNGQGFTVNDMKIEGGDLDEVRRLLPDKIISTIPAWFLCHSTSHVFDKHMIYASGSTIEDAMPVDNVLCDGTEETSWYRNANVFGYRTIEWPSPGPRSGPNWNKIVKVYKPLETDCDCNPDVIRVGRYGAWQKSFLVHQVYGKVMEALSDLDRNKL